MKKNLLITFLVPFLCVSQIKIGNDINGEDSDDESGSSVSLSLDGSIVAIGAPKNEGNGIDSGHVRVYRNNSGVWTQIGSDIDGESSGDASGSSVSLSSDGSIVAIGAPRNDNNGDWSGHVRVYRNDSGVWTQIGSDIDGEASGDESGFSVSLSSDGSIVAIGARRNNGNGIDSGHVRVYRNDSDVWTQIGSDINGEASDDGSGFSISLSSDGSIVAIGAPRNDGNGPNSGHVRVYRNDSGVWTQIGSDIDGEAIGDRSGFVSLSSDGSIVAIGAPKNDGNGTNSGHVRVYRNDSDVWTQIGSDIGGEAIGDRSGFVSLSSDGSIVAIGASKNDDIESNSGQVRVYRNDSGVWTQKGSDINGEDSHDESGSSVSLSSDGSIVAIGTPKSDENESNSGHVRVFDINIALSSNSFELSGLDLFPNPTSNNTTVKLNNGLTLEKVTIYNNLGKLIRFTKNEVIEISGLSVGIYFVEIVTNKGKAIKKLVIR